MESIYTPYFDPDYESLIERIHPPRVCIDNDTCEDCTIVKVDSANKHGILLEMVQVLTELDLIISKSYISSDGGWLMDVFHVTDQLGNKVTDQNLIRYIQQALCSGRSGSVTGEVQTCLGRVVGPKHLESDQTVLEITGTDRPGLLSEILAVLADLECHVVAAEAWTHNTRAASIIYVTEHSTGGPILDRQRVAHVEEQLQNVVGAHCGSRERRRVRFTGPTVGRTHTERRLHQLMFEDRDYDIRGGGRGEAATPAAKVSIDSWIEKGYSVLTVKSRDRPKLLFDTVCTLTDMEYVVFHATINSHGSLAVQEYYIRHMDGCTLDTEGERQRVTQCLIAAIERRVSHGLRLDVCTGNRLGLLSEVTRVFRENALSVTKAEVTVRGEKVIATFYLMGASGSNNVDPKIAESVRNEIGEKAVVEVNKSPGWSSQTSKSSSSSSGVREKPIFSLGSLWSHLERFSNNFGSIRS